MTRPALTEAQRRALDWLPKDGGWRTNAGSLSAALGSLGLRYSRCVEQQWGQFGPRGGWKGGYRLTPIGIATFYPETSNDHA